MDLGIKELGITLMVGTFTILGLELILHYFFQKRLTDFFPGQPDLARVRAPRRRNGGDYRAEKDQTITVAAFVAMAFALGMLVENLSYSYIEYPQRLIQKSILGYSSDSRIWTMVNDYEEPSDPKKKWWVAKDLARNGAFVITDPDKAFSVQTWILDDQRCKPGASPCDKPTPPQVDIRDSIIKLYYYAKNRVYAEKNYYDEMVKIQSRFEFARALALISFGYLWFAVPSGLIVTVRALWRRWQRGKRETRWRELLIRVPVVLGILFCACVFTLWTYDRESDEFNKRTYGYFSSMLISEKLKEKKPQECAVHVSTAPTTNQTSDRK